MKYTNLFFFMHLLLFRGRNFRDENCLEFIFYVVAILCHFLTKQENLARGY